MIREAGKQDIASLAHLIGELGYPTSPESMKTRFDRIREHPNYQTFVYEKNGQVVGMVGMLEAFRYENDDTYVRIVTMVVDTSFRGLGIGKELLQAAEVWAKERGHKMVNLNSGNRAERQQAHDFYIRHGFKGTATGFYKKLNF